MSIIAAAYPRAASVYHWAVAVPLMGSVGSVLKAQQSPKEEKGKWMWRHKSLGFLTGLVVAPRMIYRTFNWAKYKAVPAAEGSQLEHAAANLSHIGLYVFMTVMPASGIAMGYYGGKGLPFFWTTIPGASAESKSGEIAKQSFKIHKTLGTYGKFLIPVHIAGAFKHTLTGGSVIFSRINPFGSGPPKF
jgi:cytochrome b561